MPMLNAAPVVSDPLCHNALTATPNVQASCRLYLLIKHVLEGEDELAALSALSMALLSACDGADIDPVDTLCQVSDASDSGCMDMDPEDIRAVREATFGRLQ